MTVNTNIIDEALLKDWTKAIEEVDIDSVKALHASTPELLWTPLQCKDSDMLEEYTQRLEDLMFLGTSLQPLYPLHYLILLYSYVIEFDDDQERPDKEQQPLVKSLINYILQHTAGDELNTCLWGNECNSIMHLAYYFLNQQQQQQQQQAAELIQLLIDRGASTTIANKSGQLPPNTIRKGIKPDAKSSSSAESTSFLKEDEGPKLIINKSKDKSNRAHAAATTHKPTAAVSDKFKRLREIAEVKSSSQSKNNPKLMINRHNSAHRYFRPGHVEERKRRVLSEEEEAELEKERLKRQREVELLVQRSAVKNNPLLKKLEVKQHQQQFDDDGNNSSDNKASTTTPSATASKLLKTAVASVLDQQQPQVRRGSKMIQALKDRSYVSDSVLRHQKMLAAEDNEELNSAKTAKTRGAVNKPRRLQPLSPYDSESDEEREPEDESQAKNTIDAVAAPVPAPDLYNSKAKDGSTGHQATSSDSLRNGVVQHHQPDLASRNEDRCATVEQPEKRGLTMGKFDNDDRTVDSLTVKSSQSDSTTTAAIEYSANDKDKRILTIKGSKVREIVQVHEHLNDKEEIEIHYTGRVFSVWKRNEYGEMAEEERYTEAQLKNKSPELLELVKEKLVVDGSDHFSPAEDDNHDTQAEEQMLSEKDNKALNSSQRSSASNISHDEGLYTSRGSLNSDSTLSTISSYSTNDSIEHTRIIGEMGFIPLDAEDKNATETNDTAQIINDTIDDNYRNSLHLHNINNDGHERQQRNSVIYDGEHQRISEHNSPNNISPSCVPTSVELCPSDGNSLISSEPKTADDSLLDGIQAEMENFDFQDDNEAGYEEDEGAITPTNRNSNAYSTKADKDQRHDTVQNLVNLVKRQLRQNEVEYDVNATHEIVDNVSFNKARRQSGTQRRLWASSFIQCQEQQHGEATMTAAKAVTNQSDTASSCSDEQWYDPDLKDENSSVSWRTESQRESFMTSQQNYSSNSSVTDDDNDTASIASSVYSNKDTIINELHEKDSIYPRHGDFLLHKPKEQEPTTSIMSAGRMDNTSVQTTVTETSSLTQIHSSAFNSQTTSQLVPNAEHQSTIAESSSLNLDNVAGRSDDTDAKFLRDIQKQSKPIESARDTIKVTRTEDPVDDRNAQKEKYTSVLPNANSTEGEIVIYMNESYGRTTRLDDLAASEKPKTAATPAFDPPLSRMSGKIELKPGQLSLQNGKDYRRTLIPMAEVDLPSSVRQGDNTSPSNIPSKDYNQPRIEDISYYMNALPSLKQTPTSADMGGDEPFKFLEHDAEKFRSPLNYTQQQDQQQQFDKGRVLYAQQEQPVKDFVTTNTERWTPPSFQLQNDAPSPICQAQLQPTITANTTSSQMKGAPSTTASFEMNRYGKMYIGVSGAHHMLLPLPKEITYVRCVISDGEYEYMSRYEILTHQILMDYECVIDTKPGQIITVSLHVRPDYHVKPKTGLMSRWFTSARKQKEHLSGYVHPEDGAIGQTRFAVDYMVPACYKKSYEAQFDCFNSWYARTNRERARREQFGDEEDFLKIVGKLNIEMLFLPVSDPSLPVPRSLRECDLMLKIRQWHETCWKSSYLTTRLQGTNIWERHFYRLVGSQLIGYISDTDKQQIWKHYNIADVIRLSASTDKVIVTLLEEDESTDKVFSKESIHSDNQKGFFRLTFSDYYVDCVSDTLEDSEEWVKTLKAMIGRVPLRLPFSLD